MKSIYPYALLGALFAVGAAAAATTTTTPVGYVSLGDTTSGQPAVKANTDVTISIPLARATEFSGTVSSVSGSTITVSGTPGWTANQFTSVPYYAIISSGAENGLLAVVSANTTNTLTVTTVTGNLANIGASPTIVLTKAWTLGTFIATGSVAPGTQLIAFDGTGVGTNLAATQIYTNSPTGWVTTFGGTGSATNTILYPGESFILRTGTTAIQSLVVTGSVPTWNHRTDISKLGAGQQDNRISYFAPVGEALSAAGIPAATGDQLIAFDNSTAGKNKAASAIITKSPTGWVGTFGVSGDQSSFKIGGGAGYIYRRAASVTIGNADWSDQPAYASSL